VGDAPDIYFMEITRDNELIAEYHQKNPSREGEDVYMVSYPISVKGEESGFLKMGFLKTKVDRGIGRVKALMGLGLISIVAFFLGLVGYTRFRPSPKTHNLKLKMGGLS
jgi:hypothetical protein